MHDRETTQLRSDTLPLLGDELTPPPYDRAEIGRSIVHIGVGGFHRSHLAAYVDELCRNGETGWGIVGCGVRDADAAMAEALERQDHLYTLIERGPTSTTTTIIGSLVDYAKAYADPVSLVEAIAAPSTQIVSLTVTEAGYPIDDDTGEFTSASPNAAPASAFGLIVEGLRRRAAEGGGPVTILSCDNIMSNGAATKASTLGVAAAVDPGLVEWIEHNASFPNSMVDRITPATSEADRVWLAETHGLDDAWPVVCEPFRQWVVEDDFAGARLPLEQIDVIVTDDVEPYERMKLQLLNAGHSCLAYPGALLGHEQVHDAMADDDVRQFVMSFLDLEAKPILDAVPGIDVDSYIASLIERFSNPRIGDQVARLCQDGSGKLPKFLLPTVRACRSAGSGIDRAALLLASWCVYLRGGDVTPAPDPMNERLRPLALAATDDPRGFLGVESVFGGLIDDDVFVAAFETALRSIEQLGVRDALRALTA